jgi:uncharacterized protein involved in exopolysaccharide biosynthesis
MSSLVEVGSYAPLAPEPPPIEQGEARREVNLLHLAWRSRWLVLLCMAIGGGIGWFVLQRVTPLFTSTSRVYVERRLPQILSQQLDLGQSANYLYTQAELIRSSKVLAEAAKILQSANLETFRGIDNPVGFLQKEIKVRVGNQTPRMPPRS